MKSIVIGIIVLGIGAIVLNLKPEENQFKGYTELVSRFIKNNDAPKRAHDLDLSKYRPNFPGN